MSRKTASPSASRGATPARPARTAADAREWLGGIRFSGFAAIMLVLVVLAVAVLAPTVSTYVEQRQKIAALEEAVQLTKDEIADLERERERWKDPAYITTQARERLYYTKPGEVRFLVIDDLEETETPQDPAPVSAEVEEKSSDWLGGLLRSIAGAGVSRSAMEGAGEISGDPTPSETPAG